jgi:cell fate (sporulation/competence/biofilm development) regulator YmcA (YheA/YmcA/DUF963 family)
MPMSVDADRYLARLAKLRTKLRSAKDLTTFRKSEWRVAGRSSSKKLVASCGAVSRISILLNYAKNETAARRRISTIDKMLTKLNCGAPRVMDFFGLSQSAPDFPGGRAHSEIQAAIARSGCIRFLVASALPVLQHFAGICKAILLILFVSFALRRILDLRIGVRIPASQPNPFNLVPGPLE